MTTSTARALAHIDLAERAAETPLADDIRYAATTLVLATGAVAPAEPIALSSPGEHLRAAAELLDEATERGEVRHAEVLDVRSQLAALILSLDP